MKLSEIIDLNSWQRIQDCFAAATGFAAILVDYQGKPLLEYSGFSSFCSKLREYPEYNDKCRHSDAHGGLEAVRRNSVCIYRCHAGLVDFAIPVIVEGEYVACMMCGQVLAEESQAISSDIMARSENIFKDNDELFDLYSKIPVVPFQRIKETANLFYLILNYIIEQYLLNQKNIRLINQQKEKVELEKQYKDLEIQFYHSQINPHFLFNALNIAGRQAFLEDAQKTQEIIYALADIYRYNLDSSGFLIKVRDEVQNLKNYIFIQHIRFGEQLVFKLNIADNISNILLPAMTLQIFVENAVFHGLEKKEELGWVSIDGFLEGDNLIFEFEDNGIGMDDEKLSLLNSNMLMMVSSPKNMGMGIYNINKRLQYFYPDRFSLVFSRNSLNGVKVRLSIALSHNDMN